MFSVAKWRVVMDTDKDLAKQWLWLVAIWAGSIAALGLITWVFKLLMRWAGLS